MPVRRSTAALSSGRMPSRVQHPRANLDPGRRPAIPRSLQGHPSAHAPRRRPSRVGTAFRRNASQAEPFRPVGVGATRSRTAANTRGRGRVTSRPLGWPAPAIALVGLVTVLVGIGIIMVLSASMGYSLSKEGTPWATFERQVVWVAMGIAVFGAVSLIDYRLWRRLDGVLIAGVFLALLVVLSPLGIRKNGSQRWIGTGGLQIQPSELAKFAIAVWLSALLASRARKIHNPRLTTRPALVATAAVVVLVMLQPDMGTAIIVSIIAASVLVASGIGLRRLGSIGLWTVGLAVLAGMLEPYRRDRILSFLHPGSDAANTGFQLSQSLVGLGSGHVFGVGIGAGRAKLGFLPNSSTDFIMAIIGEELGLVGTLTVVALFAGLAVVGTHIARRAPDDFGYLVGIGLTAWLVGQAAINIGAVIGIMPITGVPLPFISAGGSSFVVVMAAVGVLVSIGRRAISVERRSDLVSLIDDAPLLAAEVRAGVRRHPSGRVRERARKKRQEPSGSRDGRRRPASPIDATRPDASRPDAPIPTPSPTWLRGSQPTPAPMTVDVNAWCPDIAEPRRMHVVACGGTAMSAVAIILHRMGHVVTGSDQVDGAVLDQLRAEGIAVSVGHDSSLVSDADLVIVSTAVAPDNVEFAAAVARGIPIAGRPAMMEAIGRLRRTIAVSGTHGKTSTTAMTTLVARAAGWNPSFIVGGVVRELGTGVMWHDSPWLVVEADESDGSFLRFHAEAVVVTNIEEDHLEFHGSIVGLERAFDQFFAAAAGPKVACADDTGSMSLVIRARQAGVTGIVTYGTSVGADYRIVNWVAAGLGSHVAVQHGVDSTSQLAIAVPGLHMARNAVAAFAVAVELGVAPATAAEAIAAFKGVGRRFERRGSARGVTFVDDYAHLPTEVAANVSAAAAACEAGEWRRVVAVFQPHRYTRTQALASQFADAFDGADLTIVTEIYAAGQQPIPGVSGRLVVEAIGAAHPNQRVVFVRSRAELVDLLEHELRSGDLCLTLNAGDLTTLPDEMLARPWASTSTSASASTSTSAETEQSR